MRNSEAIAWYVEEAQRLLEDQQGRAESLRTRGGQLAGFGALFLALIGANAATFLHGSHGFERTIVGVSLVCATVCLLASVTIAVIAAIGPRSYTAISADEITGYLSDRFLDEPDLWRVHVRSLRSLESATRDAQRSGNASARGINISQYFFLLGLALSVLAIATLIVGSI